MMIESLNVLLAVAGGAAFRRGIAYVFWIETLGFAPDELVGVVDFGLSIILMFRLADVMRGSPLVGCFFLGYLAMYAYDTVQALRE